MFKDISWIIFTERKDQGVTCLAKAENLTYDNAMSSPETNAELLPQEANPILLQSLGRTNTALQHTVKCKWLKADFY